jgi:integrase
LARRITATSAVLVATTGMRRSELAGAERDLLDLAAGTLTIAPTRVVVDGKRSMRMARRRAAGGQLRHGVG